MEKTHNDNRIPLAISNQLSPPNFKISINQSSDENNNIAIENSSINLAMNLADSDSTHEPVEFLKIEVLYLILLS